MNKNLLFKEKQKLPTLLQTLDVYLFCQKAHSLLRDLINVDDELVLLIMENLTIDLMFHRLKIKIKNEESKQESFYIKGGEFSAASRTIEINISPFVTNYSSTMIHEMSHAIVFYSFRPREIFQPVSAPFPQKDRYIKSKFLNEPFNPAELKFKFCIKEDKRNIEAENKNESDRFELPEYLRSAHDDYPEQFCQELRFLNHQLNYFFSNIEEAYKTNIFNEKALAEIFPFYMQYRVELLQLTKKFNLDKNIAMDLLKYKLPKLHDYFETDIKRLLKHRLCFFMNNYSMSMDQSDYFGKHPLPKGYIRNSTYQNDCHKLLRGFWYEHLQELERCYPRDNLSSNAFQP